MDSNRLIVLVGPPGVGKSTLAAALAETANKGTIGTVIINRDKLRDMMFVDGSANYQLDNQLALEMSACCLREGNTVIHDNTNLTIDKLLALEQLADVYQVPFHVLVMHRDLETLHEHNRLRAVEHRVPSSVLNTLYHKNIDILNYLYTKHTGTIGFDTNQVLHKF